MSMSRPTRSATASPSSMPPAPGDAQAPTGAQPDPTEVRLSSRDEVLPLPPMGPSLDHPAYVTPLHLPLYNGPVTARTVASRDAAAKVLIQLHATWTADDHRLLVQRHTEAAHWHQEQWATVADEAAQSVFGRPFRTFDYRVSGIGCAEFSEDHKRLLRHHAHSLTYHESLAAAHDAASRVRNRYMDPSARDPKAPFREMLPEASFVPGVELIGPYAYMTETVADDCAPWTVYRHEATADGGKYAVRVLTEGVSREDAARISDALDRVVAAYYNGAEPKELLVLRRTHDEIRRYCVERDAIWAGYEPSAALGRLEDALSDGRTHSECSLWNAYMGGRVNPGCASDGSTTPAQDEQWRIYGVFHERLAERAVARNVGFNVYDWTKKKGK